MIQMRIVLFATVIWCILHKTQSDRIIRTADVDASDPMHSMATAAKFIQLDDKSTIPSLDIQHDIHDHDHLIRCGDIKNRHVGNFTIYDYSILIGMLVISLGIGVFYGFVSKSGSNTSSDFLHGSEMGLLPVTLSLTTSFITAIELLGNPSEMFFYGTQFALIIISMILVIPIAVRIFYPIYFDLQLTSCYEYLGIRFSNNIRIFGAILYIIQMCFYTAVSVYAPAIALSKATGINTRLAVFLIYIVCIFYSSQGGMKAVVIADSFQAGVLAVSLVLVTILGFFYTGGFSEVFTNAEARGRIELLNYDPDPTTRHTMFSVVIGGFFYWTSLLCTNQASVQKCMSLKSISKSNMALILSIFGLVIIFISNFYTGLTIFKHYANCDPAGSGAIGAKDELLPFYIMDVFGEINFVNGIFVAGIFAASLGTVASALNSLAAVTNEDIIVTGLNIKIQPEKGSLYVKWMSLGYGVLSFLLVFLVEQLGGILQATLTLNGLIGGVTLGLFSLGVFFKSANSRGALFGGLTALVLVIYVGVMAQIYTEEPVSLSTSLQTCDCMANATETIDIHNSKILHHSNVSGIFRVSYMWYSFFGTTLTVIFGLLISWTTDKVVAMKILQLNKRNHSNHMDRMERTPPVSIDMAASYRQKSSGGGLFTVEEYRKKQPIEMTGFDNGGLKIDEA